MVMEPWTSGRLRVLVGSRQPGAGVKGVSVAIDESLKTQNHNTGRRTAHQLSTWRSVRAFFTPVQRSRLTSQNSNRMTGNGVQWLDGDRIGGAMRHVSRLVRLAIFGV